MPWAEARCCWAFYSRQDRPGTQHRRPRTHTGQRLRSGFTPFVGNLAGHGARLRASSWLSDNTPFKLELVRPTT